MTVRTEPSEILLKQHAIPKPISSPITSKSTIMPSRKLRSNQLRPKKPFDAATAKTFLDGDNPLLRYGTGALNRLSAGNFSPITTSLRPTYRVGEDFLFVAEISLQGHAPLSSLGLLHLCLPNFAHHAKISPHSRSRSQVTNVFGLSVRSCNELLQKYSSTLIKARLAVPAVDFQRRLCINMHERFAEATFKATRLVSLNQLFSFSS